MAVSSNKNSVKSLKRPLYFLKPYRFWVFVKLFSTIINALNDIFLVYLINSIVNTSLTGDMEELKRVIYMMAIFVAIGIIVNFLESYSAGRFSALAARDMKDAFSSRINELPVSYLESHHSGDLVSRITNDITKLEQFFKNDLIGILFHFIRMSSCVILMLYINWKLTFATILLIPILGIITGRISRPMDNYSSNLQRSISDTNTNVQDVINSIYMVKSFNLNRLLFKKFNKLNSQLLNNSLIIEKRKALLDSTGVLVRLLPFLLFFLFGGFLVIQGNFTAGGFVAFAQLMNYLVQGMQVIPTHIGNFKIANGVTSHLFELFDQKGERRGGVTPSDISSNIPAIEFDNVSFTYSKEKVMFKDLSFNSPQNKMLAFVGASGAGKTTIFKLLTGFYDYQFGDIKVFGESLNNWDLTSARSMFSWVSQDTYLFTGTIKDNIICGMENITQEEIEQVAKKANIHEFIISLPEQYNSEISEGGINLSGGQKQRLSLARALLKDAPVFLLDEPTSALDTESEVLIQKSINQLKKDKTVIVIAHRLSTIIAADQVMVLEKGAIVERGTHSELLTKDGAYKRLYQEQLLSQTDQQITEGRSG